MSKATHLIWISEINDQNQELVGAKAYHLGRLATLGMPIPNGFVLTNTLWQSFLAQTNLDKKLPQIVNKVKNNQGQKLLEAATIAEQLILHAEIPATLWSEIATNYRQLAGKDVHVAVRQSLIGNERVNSIGTQTSYLNIIGQKQLERAIRQAWASLFSAKAIYFRNEQGLDHLDIGQGIIIQRMVEAEAAGVSFSQDPLTQDIAKVTVEAIWGLGEPISSGQLTPDYYQVTKQDWQIVSKDVAKQEWQLTCSPQKNATDPQANNVRIPVSAAWQRKQKLTDRHITDLARLTVRLEEQLGAPQQVEWAYADHTLYIVQSEAIQWIHGPLATGPEQVSIATSTATSPNSTPLLSGLAASPGVAVGTAKIIKKATQLDKLKEGTIAILDEADIQPSPSWLPPVAIIANHGSRTSGAAMIARDLNIPAVLGAINATKMIKDGETVTVDGAAGLVYEGDVSIKSQSVSITRANAYLKKYDAQHPEAPTKTDTHLDYQTATKVMVNLSEPEQAIEAAAKNVNGVGLLRSEAIIQNIGQHPQYYIDKGKEKLFIDSLAQSISEVASAFGSRPVLYRLSDLSSQQYLGFPDGQQYEQIEINPALGFRGAYRHTQKSAQAALEFKAIKQARKTHKNIWLMIPFVRTPQELIDIKHALSQIGLHRSGSFKLFMMAELPSNVTMIDQFIAVGIDGLSIGSNDLTQLMLGVDRHNPQVATQFDERHPAIMSAMKTIIKSASQHGIDSSICGQAPSVYPEITKSLVEWGITSISVSPESSQQTRRLIADAEFELVQQGKSVKHKSSLPLVDKH